MRKSNRLAAPVGLALALAVTAPVSAGGRIGIGNSTMTAGEVGMVLSEASVDWDFGPFAFGVSGDIGAFGTDPGAVAMNGEVTTGLRLPNGTTELFIASGFKFRAVGDDGDGGGVTASHGTGFGIRKTWWIGPMDLTIDGAVYPGVSNAVVITNGTGSGQVSELIPYTSVWTRLGAGVAIPLNQRVAFTLNLGTFIENVPGQVTQAVRITGTGETSMSPFTVAPNSVTNAKCGMGVRITF